VAAISGNSRILPDAGLNVRTTIVNLTIMAGNKKENYPQIYRAPPSRAPAPDSLANFGLFQRRGKRQNSGFF
jgi:hypothetical protein